MSNIRSAALVVLSVLVAACDGCARHVTQSRDVGIVVDSAGDVPLVVLQEVQEVNGGVDSGSPPDDSIADSNIFGSHRGILVIRTPATIRQQLLWYYSYQHLRWTIFAPGRVARTVYLVEVPSDDETQTLVQIRGARPRRSVGGETHFVPAGLLPDPVEPGSPCATGATLHPALAPLSDLHLNPNDVGSSAPARDAAMQFGVQVRALREAIERVGVDKLDDGLREALGRAIVLEREALEAAGAIAPTDYAAIHDVMARLQPTTRPARQSRGAFKEVELIDDRRVGAGRL